MSNRRIGKLKISSEIIRTNAPQVAEVFKALDAVVVRAEYLYHENAIEYFVISPYFSEVDPTVMPPEYALEIDFGRKLGDKRGVLKVTHRDNPSDYFGMSVLIVGREVWQS